MHDVLKEADDIVAEDYVPPIVLRTRCLPLIDDDLFFRFCRDNDDLRLERTSGGDLIVMAPTGTWIGGVNMKVAARFAIWAEADGTGQTFGPDTGFTLPNKAVRSPDVSWVLKARLKQLGRKQLMQFAPLCPDFVLELRSSTDRLSDLKNKMTEYIECGARLGWLLNPVRREVFIYRPDQPVEHLKKPSFLSGETVLPGFTLDLDKVWPTEEN